MKRPPIFNLSQLNGINGFTISGIEAGAYTGRAANSIANMTGDGNNYLIFSAIGATVSGILKGKVFLIPNCSSSCPAILDLNQVNNTQGNFIIEGQSYGDYFGYQIAISPEKNLYISAHLAESPGASDAGAVYRINIKNFLNSTIIDLSTLISNQFAVFRGSLPGEYIGTYIGFLNTKNITRTAIFGGGEASLFNRTNNGELKIISDYNDITNGTFNFGNTTLNITTLVGENASGVSFGFYTRTISIDLDNGAESYLITCNTKSSKQNRTQNGACYGLRGSSRPWPSIIDLQYFNNSFGFQIIGKNGSKLGLISTLGNIAGTGKNNFIICGESSTECYIFLIGNSTFNWPDTIDLSNTTNAFWITISLPASIGFVTKLDDINRDGLDEIVFVLSDRILIVYGQRAWALTPTTKSTSQVTPTRTPTPTSTPQLTPTPSPTMRTPTPNSTPTPSSSASSTLSSSQATVISSTPTASISQSSTNSPTPTQAPTPSIPVIDVIVFTINPDPIQIDATDSYQLTTNDLYIANLNGIDPNDIQFSLVGDHSNYIVTVNGTQTDLFTYAELQGGYVQLFIDGTCYSGPMNVDLEASTPDTTAPSSVSLVFDVTQSLCDHAATHSTNILLTIAVILNGVGMFRADKRKIKKPINNVEEVQSQRLALK